MAVKKKSTKKRVSKKKDLKKKELPQKKKLKALLKKRGWPKEEIKEAIEELWPSLQQEDKGRFFPAMSEKLTLQDISRKIQDLQDQIKAMQSNPALKDNYPKKIKELIYWRRRQISLKRSDCSHD